MKRIAVLFHENEQHPTWYVIHYLAEFWREDGFEVRYLFGPKEYVPADLVFVHVDLSVVPAPYLALAGRYPVAVNGRLNDIRKSRISSNLLGPDDDWDGPVIVKSDLNYFGHPERELSRNRIERRFPSTRRVRDTLHRLRRIGRPVVESMNYRIFDTLDAVPPAWFEGDEMVVERFLPEMEDGHYHLRFCQMLGDRWRCTRLSSEHRVIKAHRSFATEEVEPHEEVFAWRRQFELDYGKIDYVLHEGEPVLLDINKTIGATSGYRKAEELAAARRFLAEGLYSYLDGAD